MCRFEQVAKLLTIGMLRIKCNIQTEILSPKTKYAVYLVFEMTENSYGFDSEFKGSVRFVPESGNNNNYGYDIWSVYLTTPKQGIGIGNANENGGRMMRKKELNSSFYPKKRIIDGWKEIFLGEFFNNNNGEIEIQLYEKRKGVFKSGLVIEGIEIRPSLLDVS